MNHGNTANVSCQLYDTCITKQCQQKSTYVVRLLADFLASEVSQSVEFLECDKLQRRSDTQLLNLVNGATSHQAKHTEVSQTYPVQGIAQ